MGSFNMTCNLTYDVIQGGDEVVMVLLNARNKRSTMPAYSWDNWSPVPILLEGTYNSYGRLENVKIFQSKEILSQEDENEVFNGLFESLKKHTLANRESYRIKEPKNFNELMTGNDWSFIVKNSNVEVAKEILKKLEEHPEEIKTLKNFFSFFNVKNEQELKDYVKMNQEENKRDKIGIMMFKKSSLLKLVNEFGLNVLEDTDCYATNIQEIKNSDFKNINIPNLNEMIGFICGTKDFAGNNNPSYSFYTMIDELPKNELSLIKNTHAILKLHALDMSIINTYFSTLGMSWMPSMAISEDIKEYGHKEALIMQKELLSPVINKQLKLK